MAILAVTCMALMAAASAPAAGAENAGEVLYNGIVLPKEWPPRIEKLTPEPMAVPYLKNPPDVIPIDVGRQLFVDDFLIAKTDLTRSFHQPEYCKENPVLRADKKWEHKSRGWFAAPYSGGVWYDQKDRKFKLWYCGGYLASICYAESADGIRWKKPALDAVEKGTNIVLEPGPPGKDRRRDSTSVWLDRFAKDPRKRFKYFATEAGRGWGLVYRTSPDGIHWSQPVVSRRIAGDRTTMIHNPFRGVWVVSLRIGTEVGRSRGYVEGRDPAKLIRSVPGGNFRRDPDGPASLWVGADKLDPVHPVEKWRRGHQLYNLDAVAYESLMLGFFVIWQGPSNGECGRHKLQKRNEILLGFSRDGFHWARPCRRRFIRCTWDEGHWRFGNVQSVGGACCLVGDKLYIYFTGRAKPKGAWDADASTGLVFLRRDGFASMDAGKQGGTLTTRPVTFKGKHLFVNVDCPQGELKAEVLAKDGKVIQPFTAANCNALSCDKTLARVTWKPGRDLSSLAGKPVRFRFHLQGGSLYAFWVSPGPSGASHGYVAAGGPGLTGPTDTIGIEAYRQGR